MNNSLSGPEQDALDDRILSLPCYEPAGLKIDVTVRDLLRHLLIIGQTGSGKTTILNRILSELIRYRDPQGRGMGLLVLDSQSDGTIERIRQMASEAGRLGDVHVLSSDEGFFNPIGNLQSFESLSLAVSVIVSASGTARFSGDNPFWSENTQLLLESALTVLAVTERRIDLPMVIEFTCELLLAAKWSKSVEERLEAFSRVCNAKVSSGIRAKLNLVLSTLKSWKNFEGNTRGVLRSCLQAALAPLLSATALPYWDLTKGKEIRPADALQGEIVVIGTKGSSEPETAGLITRLAKIAYYRVAQARTCLGTNSLSAIIMDELPLSITSGSSKWSDSSNLATLRSKGVAVIAATQGLHNLDLVVDAKVTRALMVNFSNVILLQSQEFGNLSEFAAKIFGSKAVPPKATRISTDTGDLLLMSQPFRGTEPICPEGALARLEPHQAFVKLASGYRSSSPVWLCPLYMDPTILQASPRQSVDHDFLALKRMIKSPRATPPFLSSSLWCILISRPRRCRTTLDLHAFARDLAEQGHDKLPRVDLESIPKCWRKALIRLADKLPPEVTVTELRSEKGLLVVQIQSPSVADGKYIAEKWRRSVYPSMVRQPSRTDRRWLRKHFPHLA